VEKLFEWFDTGSEAIPYAPKHAFGSSHGSFPFMRIFQAVMIMLHHLVQSKSLFGKFTKRYHFHIIKNDWGSCFSWHYGSHTLYRI